MELPEINWGIFILLFAVGFVMMLFAFRIWASMEFEVGLVSKILMLTVVPAIAAFGFSMWLENG